MGQDLTFFLAIRDGHLVWTDMPFEQGGREVFRFMAIPMAWSLTIELYFYAVAPFIVRRPAREITFVMALSIAARVLAAERGLTADPFSYRFFPFELALFLAGALAFKAWRHRPEAWRSAGARTAAALAMLAIVFYPELLGGWSELTFFSPTRIGTLALIACALPAIHEWSRPRYWDRRLGELSFPIYLGHLLVIALIPSRGVFSHPLLHLAAVLAVTLLLAWFVIRFVERGIEGWRRANATRAGASDTDSSAAHVTVKPPSTARTWLVTRRAAGVAK